MNESTFLDNVKSNLTILSDQYGTGILPLDGAVVFVTLGVAIFVFLFLVLLIRPGQGKKLTQSIELSKGLLGKIEKLEKQLNDTRTDSLRKIEFLTQRVQALESGSPPAKEVEPGKTDLQKEEELLIDQETGADESFFLRSEAEELSLSVDRLENAFVEEEVLQEEIAEATPIVPEIESKAIEIAPKSLEVGLGKTRRGFFQRIKEVFSLKPKLTEEDIEDLEAQLIASDIGVQMTQSLLASLKDDLKRGDDITQEFLTERLKAKVLTVLSAHEAGAILPQKIENRPKIILLVGVNGVGKTTTAAKLSRKWKEDGAKVLLVAADTFRAAAVEQLKTWGERLQIPVSFGAENAKPATVVFDALERSKQEDFDVVLIDTAGRLHTKVNLMQEIEGVRNMIDRQYGVGPDEVLLVLDGSTGQNALSQAEEFHNALQLTGLVITKLDGSSKGGIVIAIADKLGIPLRYIGVGEGERDLRGFEASAYVNALFDDSDVEEAAEPSINALKRRTRRAAGE